MSDVNASTTGEQERRGFLIGDRFYPLAADEKLGDPALVYDVTGLNWDTFQDALGIPDPDGGDDEPEFPADPTLILSGLIAIAVAHGNPSWPRHKTVRYVSNLNADHVEVLGMDGDPADPEEAKVPPTSEPEGLEPQPEPPTAASGETTLGETTGPSEPSPG